MVQETFLKLCAKDFALLRRFRSERPEALRAYLAAIAATVVSDDERVRRARKRGAGADTVPLDDCEHAGAEFGLAEQVERRILLDRVEKCMSEQKDRDKQVFWLYYRHGLTSQAISEIRVVNLSSSGVESLLLRLATAVRRCLRISNERFHK
uniref:RNA polymerase, sigma-24 subunit, ECF subfamily n=1 Tax=Solibacter usitatus (strain Ellin6076) TaxID=234267 RepID=Q01RE5_SOLUE